MAHRPYSHRLAPEASPRVSFLGSAIPSRLIDDLCRADKAVWRGVIPGLCYRPYPLSIVQTCSAVMKHETNADTQSLLNVVDELREGREVL